SSPRMGTTAEHADSDGEEVEHQVATDEIVYVADPPGVTPGAGRRKEEEARRLDGRRRQDDDVAGLEVRGARCVEVVDAHRPLLAGGELDVGHVTAGEEPSASLQGMVQKGDGAASTGVDGAAEARAEPARVAWRPAVEVDGALGDRKSVV